VVAEREGYTGESTLPWAGHLVGKNCVALGNTIVGHIVLDAMVETFEDIAGLGLEQRLMRAVRHAGHHPQIGAAHSSFVNPSRHWLSTAKLLARKSTNSRTLGEGWRGCGNTA